ncbi:MAG: hypothetical protein AAF998_14655 [Bacteroidota bacterium]
MEIPKILFGTGQEVHQRTKRWMAKVKREMKWSEIPEDEMFLTESMAPKGSGIKVLFEINPAVGSVKAFRVYSPSRYFKSSLLAEDSIYFGEKNLLFDSMVESSWGLLCLLTVGSYIPTIKMDRGRTIRFFERFLEDFEIFLGEKHLFEAEGIAANYGKYFWRGIGTQLWSAMVGAGVPQEEFQNKLVSQFDDYDAVRLIEKYVL